MKRHLLILSLLISITSQSWAINWIQRASVGTTGRQSGVGFSLGNYGFIGLGRVVNGNVMMNDFWKYDPASNSWTQVADFGGTGRYAPSCFVIADTAYVGLGSDGSSYKNDFWKYDDVSNTWVQIATFGGVARYAAAAFAVNSKGYCGTGYNGSTMQDFWEYNPANNSWLQRTNYPGGNIEASVGFTIGNYGYIGTGWNSSATDEFYKFNPDSNSWAQITSFPYTLTSGSAFVVGNMAYVGTGSTAYPTIDYKNRWWSYDPQTDTWTSFADMGLSGRYNAVSFAINGVAYAGTGGITDWTHETNDFWSWDNVGISDIENNFSLVVYPNPSSGNIFIDADLTGEMKVRVINSLSQCVYEEMLDGYVGNEKEILDLSHLAKGIYTIEVSCKNKINTKKIVLN